MALIVRNARERHPSNKTKKSPQPGQNLADVVPAAAQDSEDRITLGSFERASREASIGFHVADFRLDRAAPSELRFQLFRQPASHPGDQDPGLCRYISPATRPVK